MRSWPEPGLLLLAAISPAGGSHAQRDVVAEGIVGNPLPPLVPWWPGGHVDQVQGLPVGQGRGRAHRPWLAAGAGDAARETPP